MTIHVFDKSLAQSQVDADLPLWEIVYRGFFPTFASMEIEYDKQKQRSGIDRVVTLKSGKRLYIEEKLREKDWPDVLLEYYSDKDRKTRGWIAKDLACDYIAYAWRPSQRCLLLPFHTLRLCWRKHRHDWVKRYEIVDSKNDGYVTRGVAIPQSTLLAALQEAAVITW